MRKLLHSERGEVSIIELLVSLAIFSGVLGATLSIFETFVSQDRVVNSRNDAQEAARTSLDRLARDLRNLASPTEQQPLAVDRADASDLVFKSVDPNGPNAGPGNKVNVRRVRYCLDTSSASNAKLYAQTQTWNTDIVPDMPPAAACPGPTGSGNWNGTTTVLAEHVSNYANGQSRAVFQYNATARPDITKLHIELAVDLDIARSPKETTLSTGVFLRNQNRRPTADFTWATNSQGIVLNGSLSSDPEGQPLDYEWWDNGAKVGEGITFTYRVPANSSHTITLKVFDPADLEGDSTPWAVTA